MPAKKTKTAKVDRASYPRFWKKALELRAEARQGMAANRWNAAALNAIHAAISANDALLVRLHGQRSASPKHDDGVKLLVALVRRPETDVMGHHLQRLVAMKNTVEYEDRLCSQAEAISMIKHMERFLEWVEVLLPS